MFDNLVLAPRTEITLNSYPVSHSATIINFSFTDYATIQLNDDAGLLINGVDQHNAPAGEADANGDYAFLSPYNSDDTDAGSATGTESVTVAVLSPQITDATFTGLNGAEWGSSVSIVANIVAVGAPGLGRVAIYDLDSATDVSYVPDWTAYSPQVPSGMTPLRSDSYATLPGSGLGTVVALQGGSELFAGAERPQQRRSCLRLCNHRFWRRHTHQLRAAVVRPSFQLRNGGRGVDPGRRQRGDHRSAQFQ